MSCENEQGRSLQIDPLNMCPPIGAMYAAFGVHACLPHSHGASGCCRFQRMHLSMHFQKIVRVTSSMLTESAAVYGGQDNLKTAIENAFHAYDPQVIAIHSTCLSETIGDDINGICSEVTCPKGKYVVCASTPGYVGSHLTGYSAMAGAIIGQLAEKDLQKTERLFIIPGFINPADVDEIDRYAAAFYQRRTVFPDIRGIMDRKTHRAPGEYLPGGTPVDSIIRAGESSASIALGEEACSCAAAQMKLMDVPTALLSLPIGIAATDRYIDALCRTSGRPAPHWLKEERQCTADVVMELHPRLFGKRFALFCDADTDLPLAEYLTGIGMEPVLVCSGYAEETFVDKVKATLTQYGAEGKILREADRYDMECYLAKHPVDLLVGNSRGKILARKLGVPLVRLGFPITDRSLGYLNPIVGYKGCLNILQKILDALAEQSEAGRRAEDLPIGEYF